MSTAESLVTALLLVTLSCASADGPAPAPSATNESRDTVTEGFELAPGVVIDPPRAVYLARPEGGIEALDAQTGASIWSSVEAARPLFVGDGRLLAQRESGAGLPLAILDAADGRTLERMEAPLPEGVYAAVDESLELRFTLSPRELGGDVILEWEFLERDVLGVSPPGGRAFANRELGAVRVDLASGEAVDVEPAELPAPEGELPPPVARMVEAGELRTPPWRAGEVLAAAAQLYEPARRLVLRRWRVESGESLPEVTLLEGRAVAVLPAADSRHLLVVSRLAEPDGRHEYLWSVHSLATGDLVAARRAERSATPFCLVGAHLLFLEPPSGRRVEGRWRELPLRLRSLDPDSGEEHWHRAVRDPAFRDAPPPR